MTNCWRRVAVVVMAAAVTAACASDPPSPPPPQPPTAADAALVAYRAFWTVVDSALTAPRSKSWDADLERVASGQALNTARADVANYASLPARLQGTIQRTPRVDTSAPDRVAILDCVDLGESRVVSDTTGEVLNDLANRVQRFRYHAAVVLNSSGQWRVGETAPALSEPC